MKVPKLEDLNCSNCTERSIKLHYPDFWEMLKTKYPYDLSFTERLYWFYHGLTKRPTCKCCNNTPRFVNFKTGYREYCSSKCTKSSKDIKAKRNKTMIERYGVSNPMHKQEFKDKLSQTVFEKYGVENVFQLDDTKQKIKESNHARYGVDYPLQSAEYKEHYKEVMLEKYGVDWNSKTETYKESTSIKRPESIKKAKETFKINFLKSHPNIIDFDDINYKCKCPHPDCNKCIEKFFITPKQIYHSRGPQHLEQCTILKPIDETWRNTSIELFVRDILDEHHIDYISNDRTIIPPLELDIFIPSLNTAIECNGAYRHSTLFKSPSYHLDKFNKALSKNIRLITVWEDWIAHKPDITKSILLSKLGIYKERIYARKCSIKVVDNNTSNDFLVQNHIQGSCKAAIRLGLYSNDGELVSLMTFCKKRSAIMGTKTKDDVWELARFCNKLQTQVIGGASKLFSYFVKNYSPSIIESFSSNDISLGELYNTLGFTKAQTNQSYWYIDKNKIRYHRFTFNKQLLIKQGYSKELTESQIMNMRGFLTIYDSGQTKWIKKFI